MPEQPDLFAGPDADYIPFELKHGADPEPEPWQREVKSGKADARRAQKSAKALGLRKDAFLEQALRDPDGRLWLWDLMSECGVFESGFNPDPAIAAFSSGMRNVGLRVLSNIQRINPQAYAQMMEEQNDLDPQLK